MIIIYYYYHLNLVPVRPDIISFTSVHDEAKIECIQLYQLARIYTHLSDYGTIDEKTARKMDDLSSLFALIYLKPRPIRP